MQRVVHMELNGTKAKIKRTAFVLLTKVGFQKITYKLIADQSGVDRALVQYYFPKKDNIALDFWRFLLDISGQFVKQRPETTEFKQSRSVWVNALAYSYLLSTPELRNLTLELIESRRITDGFADLITAASIDFLNINADDEKYDLLVKRNRIVIGQTMNDLYHALATGERISGTDISINYARSFWSDVNFTESQAARMISECIVPEAVLEDGLTFLNQEFASFERSNQ